jgi:hypothetical protein
MAPACPDPGADLQQNYRSCLRAERGDRLYGDGTSERLSEELCLLARRISLPYYWKQPPIAVAAAYAGRLGSLQLIASS